MPDKFNLKQQVFFERNGVILEGWLVWYFESDDVFRINTKRGDSFLVRREKISVRNQDNIQ